MSIVDLNNDRLLPIFLVSLVLLIAATALGRWLGKHGGGRVEENVPTLEGAVLGLLALMIGFTFAMALSRFGRGKRDWQHGAACALTTGPL